MIDYEFPPDYDEEPPESKNATWTLIAAAVITVIGFCLWYWFLSSVLF